MLNVFPLMRILGKLGCRGKLPAGCVVGRFSLSPHFVYPKIGQRETFLVARLIENEVYLDDVNFVTGKLIELKN